MKINPISFNEKQHFENTNNVDIWIFNLSKEKYSRKELKHCVLGNYANFVQERYKYDFTNKPYIELFPFEFNISYSNNIMVIVISNHDIGIDIEYFKLKKNIDVLLECFLKNYTKDLNLLSIDEKCDLFFRLWIKHEAHLKQKSKSVFNNLTLDYSVLQSLSNIQDMRVSINDDVYYLSVANKVSNFTTNYFTLEKICKI